MDDHGDNNLTESQALPPLPDNDIDKEASDGVNDCTGGLYNGTPLVRKEPDHKICTKIRRCIVTGRNCLEDPTHPNYKAKTEIWAAEDDKRREKHVAQAKEYEDLVLLKYLEHQNAEVSRGREAENSVPLKAQDPAAEHQSTKNTSHWWLDYNKPWPRDPNTVLQGPKKRSVDTVVDTEALNGSSSITVKKHKSGDTDMRPPLGTLAKDWENATHAALHTEDWNRLVLERPPPMCDLLDNVCGTNLMSRGYNGSTDKDGRIIWPNRRNSYPELPNSMPVLANAGVALDPFALSRSRCLTTTTSKGLPSWATGWAEDTYSGAAKVPSAINAHAARNANGRVILSSASNVARTTLEPTDQVGQANTFINPASPKQSIPGSISDAPLCSGENRDEKRWEVENGPGQLVTWPEIVSGGEDEGEAGQNKVKRDWTHVNDEGKQMDIGAGWELM
ncbi:uncharacterized protein AB675_9503 [Cyphellophora attinorum]|uniref:Uncharacterized protein n=1 Tax=Cyphellophora attinorum TaxID=1664694 RepID=A0A0N1H780_9EURO|nr:uncharacterized protein AB675_9503 [Phialophora attinorum]KPI42226.1 hypothetical protein AB675_9503 [Phialophora attinorum]